MAFKFALILAVFCVSQGLAVPPMGGSLTQPLCRGAIIQNVFKGIVEQMDQMRNSFTADVAQAYILGFTPNVIVRCFEAQKDNYIKLGQHIYELIQTGASQLAQKYGVKFAVYGERMAEPLKNISNTVREFPLKLMQYIESGDLKGACTYSEKTKEYIAQNAEVIGQIVDDMSVGLPGAAKMVEEIALKIGNVAFKGWKTIEEALAKCIAAGGPATY